MITAPRLFVLAYNMIKNVLSPRTMNKVHMCGAQWKDILLAHIDPEQLPVAYGGTRLDKNGDPRCSDFVRIFLLNTIPNCMHIFLVHCVFRVIFPVYMCALS